MEDVSRKQDDTAPVTGVAERAGAVAGTVAGSVAGAVVGARTKVSDLGEFLREQRQQARMSLRQLAEVAGVSNPYLSQVERGLRRPSAEVLQQIADVLQPDVEPDAGGGVGPGLGGAVRAGVAGRRLRGRRPLPRARDHRPRPL